MGCKSVVARVYEINKKKGLVYDLILCRFAVEKLILYWIFRLYRIFALWDNGTKAPTIYATSE
jgi:hypothetical protein